MNERVIFDAALEIADPQARRVFIEKACAGNSGLLAKVEALLKSHDAAGSFLKVPAAEQMLPVPASGKDSADSGKPSEAFDKTRQFQARTPDDDDSDDETPPDLSFLQPSSKPGSIGLLGHYEILQVLGQGGFGIVLKAFDEKLHRLVAVKVMNPQMAASSPPRKRFLREARAAAAIRHENVVQVYSVEEQPLPYLVMEFIDGQTLQQKQKDHGPLEVSELLHIGRQVASGLAAAQAMGLIHRDIKPGNILIEQGAEQKVKITDFGLARAADDASLTRSGTISGTPMYMAPEQVLGQALDHRADLFSLGSVLYELATGRPPFRATNTIAVLRRVTEDTPRPMQQIIPEIPDWLVAIVTQLHAKKPEDRFQTAKEVADLLARCQSELQLTGKVTCVNEVSVGQGTPDDARRGSPDPAETLDRRSPLRDESQAQEDSQCRMGEVRPANATPTPPQPKRRFHASHLLLAGVAGLMVILAGTQLGRIVNPYVQTWLWPPIPKLAVTEVTTGLRFDGKDDYVKVGPIDLSSPQYTLEAFVTSAKDGDNGVIALLNNAEKEPELMYLYDGYPGKERKSGAGIVGQRPYQSVNAPLPSGTREHRALVVDGQVMHYFVNGIWQGKRYCTARKGLMWEMRELHLGCMANQTQFFRGQIDQLRLSKIARYNNNFTVASKLTSDDSTLALYNFDEAHGDVLNDSSGHGHHGKIVGATWASPNSSSNSRSQAESISSTNPDRRAAGWVLSIDGIISIEEDGTERQAGVIGDLPKGAFELTSVDLVRNQKVSDAGLAHFRDCKNLTYLDLYGTKVSDAGLAHFQDCKNFTFLNLGSTGVSDAGLGHFQNCKNLTQLYLGNAQVSDAGLAYIQDCKNLTALELSETHVSDAGLAYFQDCKHLTVLALNKTKVSDAGLVHFQDCKNLTRLYLSVTQVTDAGLPHFRDCKNLMFLELNNTQVADAGLERFASWPKLGSLFVRNTKVTETGVKKLSAALPGCKIEWDGGVIEPRSADPDRRAAEWALSIGGRVGVNDQDPNSPSIAEVPKEPFRLTSVNFQQNERVTDAGLAHFQGCKNLTYLHLGGTKVTDVGLAHFKDCKGLISLTLGYTLLTDAGLVHFKDCKNLTGLDVGGTKVTDAGLAHFQDSKNLTHLHLYSTRTTDAGLMNFKDFKNLTFLNLDGSTAVSDAGLVHLAGCPKLSSLNVKKTKVTEAGVKKLSAALPGCKIEWDGDVIEPRSLTAAKLWEQEVAKLPATDQLKAVAEKLKERNPGFDGEFKHVHQQFGEVLALHFSAEKIIDLAPIRGLPKLQELVCTEYEKPSKLKDLSPLEGLSLNRLNLSFMDVDDLSPLRGLPLVELHLKVTKVADLGPLRGMKLNRVNLSGCPVTSLDALQGMPLEELILTLTRVSDLTPIKDCPLKTLSFDQCNIRDLTHVQNMPLESLVFSYTPVTDLGPLKGLKLKSLNFENAKVRDLAPLQGMPLTFLWSGGNQISDLAPLKGMPLKQLRTEFVAGRDAELFRSLTTLEVIDLGPAKEFWQQFDARQAAAEKFVAEVAALPAEQRGKAVADKLKELNPPPHSAIIEGLTDGQPDTVRMSLSAGYHDLSPLMACPQLKKLTITNAGSALDLTPLTQIAIEDLTCPEVIALRNRIVLEKIKTLKTINGRAVGDQLEE